MTQPSFCPSRQQLLAPQPGFLRKRGSLHHRTRRHRPRVPTKPRGRRRPQTTALQRVAHRGESPAFNKTPENPHSPKIQPGKPQAPGNCCEDQRDPKTPGEIWRCPREPRWDGAASLPPGTPSRARTSVTVTAINTHAN